MTPEHTQHIEAYETIRALRAQVEALIPGDCCLNCTRVLDAPEQEPYGWASDASSYILRGQYAEMTAKAQAKAAGGTCDAYPVYREPHPAADLTDAEILALADRKATTKEQRNDPRYSGYGFGNNSLIDFARAVLQAQKAKNEAP